MPFQTELGKLLRQKSFLQSLLAELEANMRCSSVNPVIHNDNEDVQQAYLQNIIPTPWQHFGITDPFCRQ